MSPGGAAARLAAGSGGALAGWIAGCTLLRRGRDRAAFLGSCVFLACLSAATAACVFPDMLRSISDPARSMTAYNAAGDLSGLKTALRWFAVGFPLAVVYFVVTFRLHRGKAEAGEGDREEARG